MATTYKDKPLPVFKTLMNYSIFAPAIEEGGKQARLSFSFMDGRPRLSLFTNVSTDEKKGIVSTGFYPEIFYSILDACEGVLNAAPGTCINVRNLTSVRNEDGRPTGEKIVSSQLVFGKNDEGILYISLLAQGLTKIKFFFKMSEYHQVFKEDKTPISEEEGSIMVAKGWLNGVRKACDVHTVQLLPDYNSDKSKDKKNQSKAESSESMLDFDDIPL